MHTKRWGTLYLCSLELESNDGDRIYIGAAYRDAEAKLALHKAKTADPEFKWAKSDGWLVSHIDTGRAFPFKFRTRAEAYRAMMRFLPLFKTGMKYREILNDGKIRALALLMKKSARRTREYAGLPLRVQDGFADPNVVA